jgi:hypothetical protein
VMSFPPTVKISTSLTKVLVQESWSKGMSAWWYFHCRRSVSDAPSVDHGITKCHQVGTKEEVGTHFRSHGSVTQKWLADGHIAILGHCCQHISIRKWQKSKTSRAESYSPCQR